MANDQTDPKNIVKANSFERPDIVNIPTVHFDNTRLTPKTQIIAYLLGQLDAVHKGKSNMLATEGFPKYDGTNWTQNKIALFALFYLGAATAILPDFIYLDSYNNYVSPISDFKHVLKPTLSPNDHNFK